MNVVSPQKSNYGPQYYMNVAAWLKTMGDVSAPNVHLCHIRTRLDRLTDDDGVQLEKLLDLEVRIDDAERSELFEATLGSVLAPALDIMQSVQSLKTAAGNELLAKVLVHRDAIPILGG